MSVLSVQSGLIQTVQPSQRVELYRGLGSGVDAPITILKKAHKDSDSALALSDAPTGAPDDKVYDGFHCFGLFKVDLGLFGDHPEPPP